MEWTNEDQNNDEFDLDVEFVVAEEQDEDRQVFAYSGHYTCFYTRNTNCVDPDAAPARCN